MKILYILFICVCLTGCSAGIPITSNSIDMSIQSKPVAPIAPIGDANVTYFEKATLYLPMYSGGYLTNFETEIQYSLSRNRAETLMRNLLAFEGDGYIASLGGETKLSLYGKNPVEVSAGVATVNLGATALQLDKLDLYLAASAICNTLCTLENINAVNILVVDKPIGLDIANTLPLGSLTESTNVDLQGFFQQKIATYSPENNTENKAYATNVTLYYPIKIADGIMSEVKTIVFESLSISDMCITILKELSKGNNGNFYSPELPMLADMLDSPPELIANSKQGGVELKLKFSYALDSMLEAYEISRAESMASLTYTLCTFFPNLSGIEVWIGDTRVDSVLVNSNFQSGIHFPNGSMHRVDFSTLLLDLAELTFATKEDFGLITVFRAMPYQYVTNPRKLMMEWVKGPNEYEKQQGAMPLIPSNALFDDDILGISLEDNALIINFAPQINSISFPYFDITEQQFVYSMVNTLCKLSRVKQVYFFVSGQQIEGFSKDTEKNLQKNLQWKGYFLPIPL